MVRLKIVGGCLFQLNGMGDAWPCSLWYFPISPPAAWVGFGLGNGSGFAERVCCF